MAAFFEKFRAARQTKALDQFPHQEPPSLWGGGGPPLTQYLARVGKLQGEVRKEMGSWLESLSSEQEGIQQEVQTQVGLVTRRLGNTLTGLESRLQHAFVAAKERLQAGSHPDAEELALFGRRREGLLPRVPSANREPEGSAPGAEGGSPKAQGQPAQPPDTARTAAASPQAAPAEARVVPGHASLLQQKANPGHALPCARKSPSEGGGAELAGAAKTDAAEDPAALPSTFRLQRSTSTVAQRNSSSASAAYSSAVAQVIEGAGVARKAVGIAALKSASVRIGHAIHAQQGEEWASSLATHSRADCLSFPAVSYTAMTQEEREREAQRLADWLAER